MIDICTVVFRDELAALRLQAQSIEYFAQDIGVRNIYVVVNDDDWLINDIEADWWGVMKPHVIVVPRTLFSTPWVDDGWVSQQCWKLLAASISYNTWTMVMDAKTVLVQRLNPGHIQDSRGRMRVGRTPLYSVFAESQRITQELFDIEMTEQLGPGGVPFFLHNDTVRMMIADCQVRTAESFPTWFQRQGCLTEFVLYSGYVQMRYGSLDPLYDRDSVIQPVNVCHSEVERYMEKIQQMRRPETTTVSVHRGAWAQLSEEQRHHYRSLLIDRELMVAYDL